MQPSERFIAREPYFSVLADARYLSANRTAEGEQQFFDSGESDVAQLYEIARERVLYAFHPRRVLEYGCGIGRLAIPLARRAEHVTAVDVSSAMLGAGREKARGISNLEFLAVDEFRASRARFDLITCYLLLQRLPQGQGMALIRELVDRLDPGGLLVAQVPFHRSSPMWVDATRWLRRAVPGVNALANLARRKPVDTPLFGSETYDIEEITAILRASGCVDPYLVFDKLGDADGVVLYARKPPRLEPSEAPPAEGFIDVRDLLARSSIDDLNRTAETYFASLTDWDHQLAKPFSSVDDAPGMLMNLAVLIEGLRLSPGDVVLDFGAGSGWLSRFLTQLGCPVIVLDVSPTALRMARALYERMPPIGSQPAPRFLDFDGRRIDLPDDSVDRIVCFDAFHHAANPAEMIAEFARILRPGGVAGFAEPGPHHSKTPRSQFEMRTYGVVEADIDIDWIHRAALDAGFSAMKMAALNMPRFHVSVEQYHDLLDGGPTAVRWMETTRDFMRDVHIFFLFRPGEVSVDSRHGEALACAIEAELVEPAHAGEPIPLRARIRNIGRALWLPSGLQPGAVNVGCHLYDAKGNLLRLDYQWADLTSEKRHVAPGETVTVTIALPPLDRGQYQVEVDCVASLVGWFAQFGSKPARVMVDVI
jgi:SAM-dependent methyltransferase